MTKFSVTMNIAGQITIQVDAANEQEAYDNAVDAFFDALNEAELDHDIVRRDLEDISEETPDNVSSPTR